MNPTLCPRLIMWEYLTVKRELAEFIMLAIAHCIQADPFKFLSPLAVSET